MINISFLSSFFIIVLLTIFITYLSGRSTNRCLKDFAKYPVTLITKNNAIWGDFYPENSGFEIRYKEPKFEKNFTELSYIFYKQEFGEISAIIREIVELDEKQKKKRNLDIQRTYKPSILRKTKRCLYNIVIIASDVIKEVFSIAMGKAFSKLPQVLPKQKTYTSKISELLVPTYSYDGLLEKLIGKKVVLEIKKGDSYIEHPGIFKEYTKEFLEVLDVEYSYKIRVKIFPEKNLSFKNLSFNLSGNNLRIENNLSHPIKIVEINREEKNLEVQPYQKVSINVNYKTFVRIDLIVRVRGDIIIPRSTGIIRHEATY